MSVWAMKNCASKLLLGVSEKDARRVSHCGYVPFQEWVALSGRSGGGRAAFSGLVSCSSVWWCPVCSRRISAGRREELCDLLAGARAAKLAPVMLTLTFRHKAGDDLSAVLVALKSAWSRLQQRREWRRLPLVGMVTALEVTHGANGWHPHQHSLVLLDASPVAAEAMMADLSAVWLTCLAAFGLTGNAAALQVQDASAAGEYFGKFGAAEELTLGHVKRGRAAGRTPWQLLEAARDGDNRAAKLWTVFAAAFKGRRQLVWSPGLKARFDIGERPDDEVPDAEAAEPMAVLRSWLGTGSWLEARKRLVALYNAAWAGRSLDDAEREMTDAARFRALASYAVIETESEGTK